MGKRHSLQLTAANVIGVDGAKIKQNLPQSTQRAQSYYNSLKRKIFLSVTSVISVAKKRLLLELQDIPPFESAP